MRTARVDDRPILILELIPGMMNILHFLQKSMRSSYGILILYLVLILRAMDACFWASAGSLLALDVAVLTRIRIRSTAISWRMGFIGMYHA